MTGEILSFDGQNGIIKGEDTKRYNFSNNEWKEKTSPEKGQKVDFMMEENNARDIYLINNNGNSPVNSEQIEGAKNFFQEAWGYYLTTFTEHFVDFKGIANKKEFWMFQLVSFVIGFLLILIFPPLATLYQLLVILPNLAITARRLHDIGKSGWWQLIVLVPIIGIFVLIYWCIKPSKIENNPFRN